MYQVWDILLYMHLSSLQDEGYTDKEALKEAHMDKRSLIDAHKAYRESGGSFKALVSALINSDSFLLRTR